MGLMAVGKGNGDVEIFRWVERDEGGQGWVLYRVSDLNERGRKSKAHQTLPSRELDRQLADAALRPLCPFCCSWLTK